MNFDFNAQPDPAFHCNADPDPAFHCNADPDPPFHYEVDPDAASLKQCGSIRIRNPYQKYETDRYLMGTCSVAAWAAWWWVRARLPRRCSG
jgi:hypothetical protein